MLTRARIERAFWSEAGSTGSRVADGALWACSLVFETVVRVRNRAYDRGVKPAARVGARTICVGNLTVGGSGKTPLVAHLAEGLSRRGHSVAIVSRGYGGSHAGEPARVAELDPARYGDEPVMLAAQLPSASVIVGADRVASARFAVERGATLLILDDGFQHRRLARDLDLVVVDGGRGFGNGHLLPRGPLREPPSALKRAALVLVKRAPEGDPWQELIHHGIRDLAEGVPVRRFALAPRALRDAAGRESPLTSLRGETAVTVAGIGNPGAFVAAVERLGARVLESLTFPDHHAYTHADAARIAAVARARDARRIVTTAKDLVKLSGVLDVPTLAALEVGVVLDDEFDLLGWVAQALETE